MQTAFIELLAAATLIGTTALASPTSPGPGEGTPAERAAFAAETRSKGYGPQSPRDIDHHEGNNRQVFSFAPEAAQMTLCNINLHESAEHNGGQFTTYAGDGHGSGFSYDGTLTPVALPPSRPRSATARMAIWRRATPSRRISSIPPPRPSPAPPCKAASPRPPTTRSCGSRR